MTDLERAFQTLWRQLGGPRLKREYRFHPDRKWRFDFAHEPSRVGIECEGGIWSGGRHTRGAGYTKDCIKYNAATAMGWRVFRLTGPMLDNPIQHLQPIIELCNEQGRIRGIAGSTPNGA